MLRPLFTRIQLGMSAPPGYNAGESLLQGGTADIAPVMGGGGFIETNSDQSLLQGGEANIVPLKGGRRLRRKKGYPTIAHVVTSLPGMKGGGQPIELQIGMLNTKEVVPDLPDEKVVRTDITKYKGTMLSFWKRYMFKGNSLSVIPTHEKIKTIEGDDLIGQGGFDRLGILLLKSTERIIVLPPVNGDLAKYAQCISYIRPYITNPSVVILFSPRMYGDNMDNNHKILYNFIQLKDDIQTYASIYCITHNTTTNRNIGKRLEKTNNPVGPLVNLLEPTYVVYPFPRMLDKKMVGGLVFSGAAEGEVDIPISTSPTRIWSISDAVKNKKLALAFPPNTKVADTFNNINPYKVYRLFDNEELNGTPFEIVLKSAPLGSAPPPGSSDKFYVTEDAYLILDNILYKEINQGGKRYLLRRPDTNIKNDWVQLKFTTDEAALLNDMNLRPDMMPGIFGDPWKTILADFLENMIYSNCFIDGTLLTTPDCNKSQDFIQKVFQYYLEHDERISMLKENEDAADKRQVKMAKNILDNDRAEIKSEREEIKKTIDAELQRLKGFSERQGADFNIDPAALLKNPFKDGRLEYISSDITLNKKKYYSKEKVNNKVFSDIIVLHKKLKEYGRASISVDGTMDKDGYIDTIDEAIKDLQKKYPGWLFITDILSDAKGADDP